MAPLTWRNVDAPDFRGSLAGLQVFNDSIKNAVSGMNQGIESFRTDRTENADRLGLAAALQFQDPAAYKAALAAGTIPGVSSGMMSSRAIGALDSRTTSLLGNATTQQALNTAIAIDPFKINGAEQDLIAAQRKNRLGDATFAADSRAPYLANNLTVANTGLAGANASNALASAASTREGTRYNVASFDRRLAGLDATTRNTNATAGQTEQGTRQSAETYARGTTAYNEDRRGQEIAMEIIDAGGNPNEWRTVLREKYPNLSGPQLTAALARLEPRTGQLFGGGVANVRSDNLSANAARDVILENPNLSPEQRNAELEALSMQRASALQTGRSVPAQATTAIAGATTPARPTNTLLDPNLRTSTEASNGLAVTTSDSMSRGPTAIDYLAALPSNADENQVIDALTKEGGGNLAGADRAVLTAALQETMRRTGKSAAVAGLLMRRTTEQEDGPVSQFERSVFSLGGLTPSHFNTENLGNGRRFNDRLLRERADRLRRGSTIEDVLNLGTANQALEASRASAENTYEAAKAQFTALERAVTQGGQRGRARFRDEARARLEAAKTALETAVANIREADPSNQTGRRFNLERR